MYRNGRGVAEDAAEAVRWYRLSAEQGDARAQYNLGSMYLDGRGVAQDDAEAVRWYRLSAEQGDAQALYALGWAYLNGRGVAQDDAEAVRWVPPVRRAGGRHRPVQPRGCVLADTAPDHAAAPARGTLLRRRAARAPGEPSPRDSRGLRRRVGDVPRRCRGGDPRPDRRQDVSHRRAHLRSATRRRNGRGARGATVLRRSGERVARREGCGRGARRGDRGQSRMGGPRRPRRKRLPPLPPRSRRTR